MDMSSLPKAAELAAMGARAPRWRPGLAAESGASLHNEVFASSTEGSGAGLALALALDDMRVREAGRQEERGVLWVQDAAAIRLTGRPYRAGLPEPLRHRLIHVAAREAVDALFALEEGVRCRDLACVIGEIAGNPRALDFTASRRLTLAAQKHEVPLFLVRLDARRNLSSARMRWQVTAAPSPPPLWNRAAPGVPAWHAELFRSRNHAPGEWLLRDEGGRLEAERYRENVPDAADALQEGHEAERLVGNGSRLTTSFAAQSPEPGQPRMADR